MTNRVIDDASFSNDSPSNTVLRRLGPPPARAAQGVLSSQCLHTCEQGQTVAGEHAVGAKSLQVITICPQLHKCEALAGPCAGATQPAEKPAPDVPNWVRMPCLHACMLRRDSLLLGTLPGGVALPFAGQLQGQAPACTAQLAVAARPELQILCGVGRRAPAGAITRCAQLHLCEVPAGLCAEAGARHAEEGLVFAWTLT